MTAHTPDETETETETETADRDGPTGGRQCVACDRSLAAAWTYCPACGFDTRDTPSLTPTAPTDGGDVIRPRRVRCHDCGWVVLVEHGALQKETPIKESAKKRRAGHIAGKGCPAHQVKITPVDHTDPPTATADTDADADT